MGHEWLMTLARHGLAKLWTWTLQLVQGLRLPGLMASKVPRVPCPTPLVMAG